MKLQHESTVLLISYDWATISNKRPSEKTLNILFSVLENDFPTCFNSSKRLLFQINFPNPSNEQDSSNYSATIVSNTVWAKGHCMILKELFVYTLVAFMEHLLEP